MDFRNCIECGSLFRFISRNRCPDCIANEEKDFAAVYNYLSLNKQSSIDQVSEATGVSTRKIIRFLREDRLSAFKIEGEGWINCSRCGKPINTKSLCDNCSVDLAREICGSSGQQAYIDQILQSQRHRMFTADHLRKTV